MDTSSVNDAGSDRQLQEQPQQHGEQQEGHSGEGAASVLAHMKSQTRHRQSTGDADDAAGSGGHAQ